MAMVDFSNARIGMITSFAGYTNCVNPVESAQIGLGGEFLYDANARTIVQNASATQLINQQKQLMYIYQGTFIESGTEFYKPYWDGNTYSGWKISNISFQSGDTYVFQINANLVCN